MKSHYGYDQLLKSIHVLTQEGPGKQKLVDAVELHLLPQAVDVQRTLSPDDLGPQKARQRLSDICGCRSRATPAWFQERLKPKPAALAVAGQGRDAGGCGSEN